MEKHLQHPKAALEPRLEDTGRLRGGLEDLRQPDSHSEWADKRGPVTFAIAWAAIHAHVLGQPVSVGDDPHSHRNRAVNVNPPADLDGERLTEYAVELVGPGGKHDPQRTAARHARVSRAPWNFVAAVYA